MWVLPCTGTVCPLGATNEVACSIVYCGSAPPAKSNTMRANPGWLPIRTSASAPPVRGAFPPVERWHAAPGAPVVTAADGLGVGEGVRSAVAVADGGMDVRGGADAATGVGLGDTAAGRQAPAETMAPSTSARCFTVRS